MVKFHALIVYTPLNSKEVFIISQEYHIKFCCFYKICTLFPKQYDGYLLLSILIICNFKSGRMSINSLHTSQ